MGCQISRKNDSDQPVDLVVRTETMTNHDTEINYKARLEKKLCLVRKYLLKIEDIIIDEFLNDIRPKKHLNLNLIFPIVN